MPPHAQLQPQVSTSVNASLQYGTGSVQTSGGQDGANAAGFGSGGQQAAAPGGGKSRQGTFVRTYKQNKSRQVEDLDRPFGTERVSFHKSALVSNQGTRKSHMTHEEAAIAAGNAAAQQQQVPAGYKRPVGSINTSANAAAGTVRV